MVITHSTIKTMNDERKENISAFLHCVAVMVLRVFRYSREVIHPIDYIIIIIKL